MDEYGETTLEMKNRDKSPKVSNYKPMTFLPLLGKYSQE